MLKILTTALFALLFLVLTFAQAADKPTKNGPQLIRFYKVNKQQQADRLRISNKKTRQAGCHNMLKRTRVHRAVQIGYAQCQLFAEKECATDSLVKVSRDNKGELIEDADNRRQEILTRIVQEREAKERYEKRAAAKELQAEVEAEEALNDGDRDRLEAELDLELDKELDEEPNEAIDEKQSDASEENVNRDDDSNDEGDEGESKELEEIDYAAIEAGLKAQLGNVPSREQIISTTAESLTNNLTQGFAWYPESDNLRGVKIRSWSCTSN